MCLSMEVAQISNTISLDEHSMKKDVKNIHINIKIWFAPKYYKYYLTFDIQRVLLFKKYMGHIRSDAVRIEQFRLWILEELYLHAHIQICIRTAIEMFSQRYRIGQLQDAILSYNNKN